MNKGNLYKGSLEFTLLKLLAKNNRMYGYEITQRVKELATGELRITEGDLYSALHQLETEGLLEAELENLGNRVRKYYSLTKAGKKVQVKAMPEPEAFKNTPQLIFNPKLA